MRLRDYGTSFKLDDKAHSPGQTWSTFPDVLLVKHHRYTFKFDVMGRQNEWRDLIHCGDFRPVAIRLMKNRYDVLISIGDAEVVDGKTKHLGKALKVLKKAYESR